MQWIVLTRRADFLAAARAGKRASQESLVVQGRRRAAEEIPGIIRIGFTATKALGGAVVRNRVKRRMRAAAAQVLPELGLAGCDYVFIGRTPAHRGSFEGLISDMKRALKRLSDTML